MQELCECQIFRARARSPTNLARAGTSAHAGIQAHAEAQVLIGQEVLFARANIQLSFHNLNVLEFSRAQRERHVPKELSWSRTPRVLEFLRVPEFLQEVRAYEFLYGC